MKRIIALASLFALTLVFLLGTAASAQYPPVSGSITVTAGSTTVAVGGSTTLTATVLASNGSAVAGALVTITIKSEPGGATGDAGLDAKTVTKTTDANGIVTDTLHVGSTPGVIVIGVQSGAQQSSVIVTVAGSASAAPPASNLEGNVIAPPSTGDAGLKH